ncbi:MAG: hypothetical protein AABW46_02870, partial [Nanoarchaeota archaeon]
MEKSGASDLVNVVVLVLITVILYAGFFFDVDNNLEKGFASEKIQLLAGEICDSVIGSECIINQAHNVNGANFDYVAAGYVKLTFQSGGSFTTTGGSSFRLIATNIEIRNGGSINGNVDITASNLDIQIGGKIDVSRKGSAGGPGQSTGFGGAGYGSKGGGIGGGPAYVSASPSLTQPIDFGSSAAGSDGGVGGGKVKITLTGILTLNGNILANGGNGKVTGGQGGGGGGSGGSVFINVDTIDCTSPCSSFISANGGNGVSPNP